VTTIAVQLPVGLAKRFTRIADREHLSHEDLARVAIRLFAKAVEADERTNQPTNQPTQDAGRDRCWRIRCHDRLRSVLAGGSAAVRGAIVRDIAVELFTAVERIRSVERCSLRAAVGRCH
jgi:hypothetical protein